MVETGRRSNTSGPTPKPSITPTEDKVGLLTAQSLPFLGPFGPMGRGTDCVCVLHRPDVETYGTKKMWKG